MGSSRYGKRAARFAASLSSLLVEGVWKEGASVKRTDLGEGAPALRGSRSDFLRKEEDEVTRGLSEARAKSEEREGSLGLERMAEVLSAVPWNCE